MLLQVKLHPLNDFQMSEWILDSHLEYVVTWTLEDADGDTKIYAHHNISYSFNVVMYELADVDCTKLTCGLVWLYMYTIALIVWKP